MFVILRGAHARFERGRRPDSADDTCCPSASAEILRGSCALFGRPSHVPRDCPTPQVQASSPGGGTCAGSLVESGSVGASLCALRACLPAHFFAVLPRSALRIFLRFRQDGGNVMRRSEGRLSPGFKNGRSAEDQVSRTPDNQAEASAFVRISPCAWRRAPVPWWR